MPWADFANKFRERPEDEPRVRLPAEVAEEKPDVGPKGMVYPEAPFQLGPHLHVVRHEVFLQCLDCGRQTGKVKGKLNLTYLNNQDCRPLKKKQVKKRPTGFTVPEAR
eukprot:3558302-Amphidinium_carterae.1